jgi:hypothetical protein
MDEKRRRDVERLVEDHAKLEGNPLLVAVWYRSDDPDDVLLLEIAENVPDPGDGSWDVIKFLPPREFPNIKGRVRIAYMSPSEFFRGAEDSATPGHRILAEVRAGQPLFLRVDETKPEAARIKKAIQGHGVAG